MTDLVFLEGGSIRVLLGNGDGTFAPAISPLPSIQTDRLLLADLNGDGTSDLFLYGYGGVRGYLSNGTGYFLAKFAWNDEWSLTAAFADVNGDSRPDLIAGSSSLRVFLNDGTGGFGSPIAFPGAYGRKVGNVVAADFNGDGRVDLAVQMDDRVSILLGDATGHFTESSSYLVDASYEWQGPMLVADLDGDARPDVIGINGYATTVLWSLRNSNCVARRLDLVRNIESCGAVGTPFSSQPVVSVVDDADNQVICPGTTVSASLVPGKGNPAGALMGTATIAVVGGNAYFNDLGLDSPGAGYRVRFAHSQGLKVLSREFSLAPLPPSITVSGSCSAEPLRLETSAAAESYRWEIDGVVVGTQPAISASGISPGVHALSLRVVRDACVSVASQSLTVSRPRLLLPPRATVLSPSGRPLNCWPRSRRAVPTTGRGPTASFPASRILRSPERHLAPRAFTASGFVRASASPRKPQSP